MLYGAGLCGEAVALGLWQRGAHALDLDAAGGRGIEVLRRSTGGPAAFAGKGILYVALCLRHASVFMSCPPDRVLNRNVRGVLGGLSLSGTPAHYFGREWLSVARRPAALVGWDRLDDGRVMLEFFVGCARTFVPDPDLDGYPAPSEERFLGKEPVTLAEAWEEEHSVEQMMRWIAEGHIARFGGEVRTEHSSLTDRERRAADDASPRFAWQPDPEEDALRWSRPRQVAVGWVAAGARLDAEGRLADVRVAGDFYQDHGAPAALRGRLVGEVPSAERYAEAVNSTWDGTTRVIEGLKRLDTLLECLMEAAPPR